ncbi:hypothetical protein HYALB_00003196 [Hymenoscyphus albidus]|uniref:Rho-GAP domain-containing protein n=1 Tax=Hymenoscyphus albidus TaxID=595503 RepID=A0A9N9M0Z9_9HELO|nr:hypothetical protein HYALB_00003196 [Hymenoscyphus albidus]
MANHSHSHDFAGPSSSQQPFSSPHPQAIQATSPPTKQNLKSWWAGFRKEAKKVEPQGNYNSSPTVPPGDAFTRENSPFLSQSPRTHHGQFREGSLDEERSTSKSFVTVHHSAGAFAQNESEEALIAPAAPHQMITPSKVRGNTSVITPTATRHDEKNPHLASAHPVQESSATSDAPKGTAMPKHKARRVSGLMATLKKSNMWASKARKINANSGLETQSPGIFGVPLRQSITYANVAISLVDAEGKSYIYGYVPIVVAKCGVYLKEKATNVEGIFRLSGSEKRIKELKTIFDSPERYGKGLDWAGYTVHDAANVLRRYLNLLPEPIVPLDLYDRFRAPLRGHTMQAVGDTEGPQLSDGFDIGQAITIYQQLITELPPLNRQLLLYILDLLAVFASKSDENRMNSQNLAAIFQPGMLSHPSHDMAPSEYRLSQDVLIFLIENQDHFLIGMRGTAADEQTVQEVQAGATPPGTPRNKVARSASNASAGADSVRKYGGIRRNMSVSSRHSRQSNNAPSPASPALTHSSGGLNRSNTVPSKRSPGPGAAQSRLQKNSGSPSPTGPLFTNTNHGSGPSGPSMPMPPRGLSPSANASPNRNVSPSSAITPTTPIGRSSLAPSSHTESVVTSQERLLADPSLSERPEVVTPQRERNLSSLFNRSPTVEGEKKQPNKLKKKMPVTSANPSAQSSTNSLHAPPHQLTHTASPSMHASQGLGDVTDRPVLETIVSHGPAPMTNDTTPPATQTPRPENLAVHPHFKRPEEHSHVSDKTLKPTSSPSSLHSHSSFNDLYDQSDADHGDEAAGAAEQREKLSRWKRLSRHRESSQNYGHTLSPRKGLGSDGGAAASTSSVGSASRPARKSFTSEWAPVGSDSTFVGTHSQPSNDSGSASGACNEEKKGPLLWIKNKMREKREETKEKEAEKERNKSPPASTERLHSMGTPREKSMDLNREEAPEKFAQEPRLPQSPPQQFQQPRQSRQLPHMTTQQILDPPYVKEPEG